MAPRKKVLVVDDNESICELLVAILSRSYEVSAVPDGQKGLARALDVAPDVILCDAVMPVMGGAEFMQELRKDSRIAHIPVVLMSGRGEAVEQGMSGAREFLEKPFGPVDVTALIERVLAGGP